MSSNRIEVCDPEELIERECTDPVITRDNVASSYALAMRVTSRKVDWSRINRAIVARWSMAGLVYIKRAAHSLIRQTPAAPVAGEVG